MTFRRSDLSKVLNLARLSLTEIEIEKFEQDLERIIDFVAQLKEVNIEGIKPMSHSQEFTLALREDVAQETLGRECIKTSAGYEDGLIKVPKIIE
jgi:aspartyl-tRNA(Asn)/glutamyl-tRNA(Gln) amidotransferase subunit C